MRTQPEAPLQEEQRREGTRDQKQIVEVSAKEDRRNLRLECPAVQSVKRTREQKKRIAQITERLQSKARMMKPKARARTSFTKRTIGQISPESGEIASADCSGLAAGRNSLRGIGA